MKNHKAHLVGIKGVAMTSLALILKEKGLEVTGSDVPEYFPTDDILKTAGIRVHQGFSAGAIGKGISLVVSTGAHGGATNVEAKRARELGIPFYMHGKYLGMLFDGKFGIAVAGCHGKTTTSSLIAFVLEKAGLDPTYAIGTAYIKGLGPAGHFGLGEHFIAEADEYMTCPATDKTPRFLHLHPDIAVITNIDFDHPDEFKDINEVTKAYVRFVNNVNKRGIVVACIDDLNVRKMLGKVKKIKFITYGFGGEADYRILNVKKGLQMNSMVVRFGNSQKTLDVSVPGRHNLLNALAAAIVLEKLGLSWEIIRKYLSRFQGSNRRFELINKFEQSALFDDYAHHPNEIKATIKAAKERFPGKKLIVVFQPHTYTRTRLLLDLFSESFQLADRVFVTDIFPSAREISDKSINSGILIDKINNVRENAVYVKNVGSLVKSLKREKVKNSVLMTMGAGNLYLWHKDLIKFLKVNE